jgi:hypothetical protein
MHFSMMHLLDFSYVKHRQPQKLSFSLYPVDWVRPLLLWVFCDFSDRVQNKSEFIDNFYCVFELIFKLRSGNTILGEILYEQNFLT